MSLEIRRVLTDVWIADPGILLSIATFNLDFKFANTPHLQLHVQQYDNRLQVDLLRRMDLVPDPALLLCPAALCAQGQLECRSGRLWG